ncbi:hypothetical protein [Saccharopolyspora gregorii]|uniref:hypothetical protein n=1 Tax=Saccharopolyspora gregorii TaxID=33914 RepID=UPI0021AC5496|nr:hypothetical protein [Saccharopolyspora gregorii]
MRLGGPAALGEVRLHDVEPLRDPAVLLRTFIHFAVQMSLHANTFSLPWGARARPGRRPHRPPPGVADRLPARRHRRIARGGAAGARAGRHLRDPGR